MPTGTSTALLTFPPDVGLRATLFPPAARRHPGKLHLGFLDWLARRYIMPGSRVVDPMGGSGSALLLALEPWSCTVVLHELEALWVAAAQDAWAWMRATRLDVSGTATFIQGDARQLRANLACGAVDGIICSPPYADALQHRPEDDKHPDRVQDRRSPMVAYSRAASSGYQGVDAVITSPPYADALSPQRHSDDYHPERQVGHRRGANGDESMREQRRGYDPEARGKRGANPLQVGNLSGARYTAAMGRIYGECAAVLRPGGVLIVVLKNIIRDHQEVDLVEAASGQLTALGLTYEATHWRATGIGPFHRIRLKRFPGAPVVMQEAALVFRKGEGSA